jgi:hypothetical protein
MRIIDYSLLQVGDIISTRGPGIGDLISCGQEVLKDLDGHNDDIIQIVMDAIKGMENPDVPSHFLYVYDSITHTGAEMTAPHIATCDLNNFNVNNTGNHIIQAYRCPWLNDKINPTDASMLRTNMKVWLDTELKKATSYGYLNYPAFFGLGPEDYKHAICDIWVMNGLIQVIQPIHDCAILSDWIVKEHNCCGLVDPLQVDAWLNSVGWGIEFTKTV